MKKLVVDKDVCIGCGACVAIDESHFNFDDNGLSEVISQENLDNELIEQAINSCPVGAIKIKEACKDGCTCGCAETKKCTCKDCDCNCEH